ncbi:MAG: adenine methyltransferase [Clostridiales bacterium GWC2_40_7]|nr:MAG: adenine methyltransferase [Clostridiales bacterium GWC2_40_7]
MNLPVNKALFLSSTDLWETPQWIFDQLNQEFHFICDVCALPENTKCSLFFTPEMDGLQQNWKGVCWMNPPYGRKIGQWVKRAFEQSILHAATVVCLLPSRTDTSWWHDYCMKGEIRFVRGRLKFGSSKNNAPFPSAVVIFSKNASVNTIKSAF